MNRWMLALRLAVAMSLVLALTATSPTYFSLLRVLTSLAALETAWLAFQQGRQPWVVTFSFIAVLWNPIYPIRMSREAWHVLDIAAAGLFAASTLTVRSVSLVSVSITASLRRFRLAILASGLLLVSTVYVETLLRDEPKLPHVPIKRTSASETPEARRDRVLARLNVGVAGVDSVEQSPQQSYKTLIAIHDGRIDQREYSQLPAFRQKLLEIRLREASRAGDRIAEQALRDIQQWAQSR